MKAFLESLGLQRWQSLFEEVDGATLAELGDDDLKEKLRRPRSWLLGEF